MANGNDNTGTDSGLSAAAGYAYDRPTPTTDAFMVRIDDSEIDLDLVRAAMADLECERDSALAVLRDIAEMPSYDQDDHCRLRHKAKNFLSHTKHIS